MKCEHCNNNSAHVRLDHTLNGQMTSTFLCQACLNETIGNSNANNPHAENNTDKFFVDKKGVPPPFTQKRVHQTPNLDHYGRDLTEEAAQGKLDPIVRRDHILQRLIIILGRRQKNNPVLIGEPGVGKTAIVEGLACRIHQGSVPQSLQNKRIVSLNLGNLIAGSSLRGQFEQRIKTLLEEVQQSPDVIIFIDELHTVVKTGAAEGAMGIADIIKPALARGELCCIGATTLKEYRQDIEKDQALERRFQPIMVDEPSIEDAIDMLRILRPHYETFHGVTISEEALQAAVKLSDRYIHDRFLPDKAIDVIDETCSMVRLEMIEQHRSLLQPENEHKKREETGNIGHAGYAANMYQQEAPLQYKIGADKTPSLQITPLSITLEHVTHVISAWTSIPMNQLLHSDHHQLQILETNLHKHIIGQDEAIHAVSTAIRRAQTGLKDIRRPIGSFLFLGPTGVGKTELVKALTIELFGTENSLVRLDMSEYMEAHAVSRLFGSPPGYIGYEQAGQLTEIIRRRPYSVILFDEIEKAHPNVFNTLLQVFDDGRLTDGQGHSVDFKNTILIMTSNVGSQLLKRAPTLGFRVRQTEQEQEETLPPQIVEALRSTFSPEFLNRIDQVVLFHALQAGELYKIVDLLLNQVRTRLSELKIELIISDEVPAFLIEKGFYSEYGARPLRRAIQTYIDNVLADALITGELSQGQTALLSIESQKIVVSAAITTQLQPG